MTLEFVGAEGNTFDRLCDGNQIPDSLTDDGEQLPGATVDGNICAVVPIDQIEGGAWAVSELISLDGTKTYFARS